MPRFTLSLLLVFAAISLSGQNINVTFSGTGAATRVDHVTATNLRTDKSVTLPGNETLVLEWFFQARFRVRPVLVLTAISFQ